MQTRNVEFHYCVGYMSYELGNHKLSDTIDLSQYQITYERGRLKVRTNDRKVIEAARHCFGFFGFGIEHMLTPTKSVHLKRKDFIRIGQTLWGNKKEFDERFPTEEEKNLCTHSLLATIKSSSPTKMVSKEAIYRSVFEKTKSVEQLQKTIFHLFNTLVPTLTSVSSAEKAAFLHNLKLLIQTFLEENSTISKDEKKKILSFLNSL